MSEKQLKALAKSSQKKKQEALSKTEKAIARLVNKKHKITIRAVAREAGVSVSYIYKYPELSYRIQTLREQQKYSPNKGDKSHLNADNYLKTLEQKNTELLQETEYLKGYVSKIKIASGNKSLDHLQQENVQLRTENEQLKRELEYTRINLLEAREFILSQLNQSQEASTEIEIKNNKAILRYERKIKQL